MNLYRHLSVGGRGERTPFTSPRSGGRSPIRDRYDHGRRIHNELTSATDQAITWLKEHRWTGIALGASSFYLEFLTRRFEPELFESKTYGIEVVAAVPVAEDPALMRVTLYVPLEARSFFQDKIAAYLDESQDNKEGPANEQVISRIESIAFREPLELLWTDPPQWFPKDRGVEVWWEVWIKIDLEGRLIGEMRKNGIQYKPYYLTFPERYARLVRATPMQIESLLETGAIAELRRGTAAPSAVLGSPSAVQFDTIDEMLGRTIPPPGDAPSICLMDTGVNVAHPLLSPATSAGEAIAWEDGWGKHDGTIHGHGTQMAGTALYGNLTPLLTSAEAIELTHRVESIKVVPDENNDPPEIEQYGHIFHQSALKAEKEFPERTRIFCCAVSDESGLRGMPTEWSSQIDNDSADRTHRRLFVVSGGNLDYEGSVIYAHEYPDRNDATELCAPAQAWNALTIGAYTELQDIKHPDYSGYAPLATSGALCPQSRTSVPWDRQWPIKPDIVLEGGNFATQAGNPHATAIDDLQLLSTNADFLTAGPLTSFGFTSGATAQAARMCASIAAMYPELWPETIRGLIVHSASHTPEMRKLYSEDDMAVRRAFLGRFGHGVPDIQRALWSLQHDLTLVIEGEIQPFALGPSGAVSNEVIYFDLPWPTDVLQDERYYGSDAQLRITLSYFVEANAARRGFSGRYRYASHGLRFAVRRPGELPADFRKRVNDLERDDGYINGNESEKGWFIKSQVRNRGSLIQDTWTGSAAELADRGTIAIYPIGGWWKTINPKRHAERKTRFSLLVSLSLADSTADLYTPIRLQVEALEI